MAMYSKEEQLELIGKDLKYLANIDNQYEEVCLKAIKQSGYAIKYIKEPTEEMKLLAVKNNGLILKYIDNQNSDICLEAIRQNPLSFKYVKNQTEAICLEVIKYNSSMLEFIKEPTEEMCLIAVKDDLSNIEYCKEITPEISFISFLNEHNAINSKQLSYSIRSYINSNPTISNKIFCIDTGYAYYTLKKKEVNEYEVLKLDYNSLKMIKNLLIEQNSNNYFIIPSYLGIDLDILKLLAISNNTILVIHSDSYNVDKNLISNYKILANQIIEPKDLENFNF